MVLVKMDRNAIVTELVNNLTSGKLVKAYQNLADRLTSSGIAPTLHILDKKYSDHFKIAIYIDVM